MTEKQPYENSLTIRKAVLSDADKLSKHLITCWAETYSASIGESQATEIATRYHNPEMVSKAIDDPSRIFLLALQNDQVIGTARAKPVADGAVFLECIYIASSAQKQSIGTHLLKRVLKPFDEKTPVYLEVEQDNSNAIHFYKQHGFEINSEEKGCMQDAVSTPVYIMKKG